LQLCEILPWMVGRLYLVTCIRNTCWRYC